ncbi:phosphoglycerate kinase family protein [Striga asiatica]|uniref:Phosphoglycerate kinase family protein n=1 Tax=Striga asiatica TaxID=4170 RepID=A0A5A7P370_STRAF|nr:phosphoglycerate kinase family protein [Striga asiatica]
MPRLGREATQDELLYDGRWTKEVDNLFIDLLSEAHVAGEWRQGRSDTYVFLYCRGVLVADVGATFIMNELQERFDFLHKRFCVFGWMLRKHGLRHCIQSNVLTAPVAVWNDIFEGPPLGGHTILVHRGLRSHIGRSGGVGPKFHQENDLARLTEQSYVFLLSSLTNASLNSSIGNNGILQRFFRERDASSEAKLNK